MIRQTAGFGKTGLETFVNMYAYRWLRTPRTRLWFVKHCVEHLRTPEDIRDNLHMFMLTTDSTLG